MTAAKKITSSNKSEDQPDVAYANNKSPKNMEFDVGNKRGSRMAKLQPTDVAPNLSQVVQTNK